MQNTEERGDYIMKHPEILAPVGGWDQLYAAVRSGADAVYLGTKGFNARQNAKNFDNDELKNVVKYCHARNVAVHVTLNTLLFDNEIELFIKHAKCVCESGVDAVIVQDLATAKIIRECCPEMPMHASTQMAVHNIDGVKAVQRLGFSRAVLARELSLEEIKYITENSEIEIEVFVHGALCTCISGACYLSSMLGGRSGNRGYCAQPCRLDFKNKEGRGYALSLKDMTHIPEANKIAECGVVSFKIEGRMKRPEYVAAAVTALKTSLDGGNPNMQSLESVFSRSGFTNGYLINRRNVQMYGYRRKEDVDASAGVLGKLAALYRVERQSVPVDMSIVVCENKNVELTVTDGERYVCVTGDTAEIAVSRPACEEFIRKSLEKTGGTPFYLDKLTATITGNVTVPASKLNALRREALEKLLADREKEIPKRFEEKVFTVSERTNSLKQSLWFRFESVNQIMSTEFANKIILPIDEIITNRERLQKYKDKLIIEIPDIIFGRDDAEIREKISVLQQYGVCDVLCGNIGSLELALSCGCIVHGNYGLNITNSISLGEYEKIGLEDAVVSFELGMNKIKRFGGGMKRGILAYGYLPLMKLRCCPARTSGGCAGCNGRPVLKDRIGVDFPLMCKNKKYTELLNSIPLYIGDKNISNVDFEVLYFTVEDKKAVKETIETFIHKKPFLGAHTNGLYYREVL